MKRFLLATAALLAVAAPLTLAAPANAAYGSGDTRPCVTQGEFDRVQRGMTMGEVNAIFDTAGHYQGYWSDPWWASSRDVYRDYAVCPGFNRGQRIEINFDNYMHNRPGLIMWSKTARSGLWY